VIRSQMRCRKKLNGFVHHPLPRVTGSGGGSRLRPTVVMACIYNGRWWWRAWHLDRRCGSRHV